MKNLRRKLTFSINFPNFPDKLKKNCEIKDNY